jgi:SAM-dependent methyltransferase
VSDRAELYRRLPLLDTDRRWLELAAEAPDGRILELGAGTGRLTSGFLAAGYEVTAVDHDAAMLSSLRARVGHQVEAVQADVAALPHGPPVGLVVMPASLLNELPDEQARAATIAGAARRCRPDGLVVMQVLSPWWLVRLAPCSSGRLHPADGGPAVDVVIEAGAFDAWTARRQATLSYTFHDGTVVRDELDAAVITPTELLGALTDAGLELVGQCDATSSDVPGLDAADWWLVARPRRDGDF